MKTEVDPGILLTVFACDFCLMQGNSAAVLADHAVKVEAVDERITLNNKVIHIEWITILFVLL